MDSKNVLEPPSPMVDLTITPLSARGRSLWANKAAHIRRITVAGSLILLIFLGFSTLHQRVSCHGPSKQIDLNTSPFALRFGNATPEGLHGFLHKYFPVRHTVEPVPHTDVATTLLRLARRQDNTTTSPTSTPLSTPTPTSSQSTSSSSSSSSSLSSTSSSDPPPPRTEPSPTPTASTTTSPTITSTTVTTNAPTPPTVSAATVDNPGTESTATVTNPGTSASSSTSPSQEARVQNTASSGTVNAVATTTEGDGSRNTNEPQPPSTINGGTLTRSTTRDGNGVDAQGSTRTTTRSSKMLVATLTSTMPNGRIVVVTSTTYVPPDPSTTFDSTTVVAPSLHNSATQPKVDPAIVAAFAVVLIGAVFGAAMA